VRKASAATSEAVNCPPSIWERKGRPIVKGAFADTIAAWQHTGRTVPLHWSHSPEPDDIIGSVDPRSMRETDEGLVVKGELDLDNSERARQAWRAMKTGSMALSFGYLTQRERQAADGANELLTLDLFEISLTPGPSNPATRVLDMKSVQPQVPSDYELRLRAEQLGIKAGGLNRVRTEARDSMLRVLTGSTDDTRQSKSIERKSTDPIQVQVFEC
jgi:HK97 family phage prohead protease